MFKNVKTLLHCHKKCRTAQQNWTPLGKFAENNQKITVRSKTVQCGAARCNTNWEVGENQRSASSSQRSVGGSGCSILLSFFIFP